MEVRKITIKKRKKAGSKGKIKKKKYKQTIEKRQKGKMLINLTSSIETPKNDSLEAKNVFGEKTSHLVVLHFLRKNRVYNFH